jgi:mannose-6-phosphate isomerase-like protein (cupin superfamily)
MIKIITEEHDKTIVIKRWGDELILHNDTDYCGKLLHLKAGFEFSMHFHMLKNETWYVNEGEFGLHYIDTATAEEKYVLLTKGSIVDIPKGAPHQLTALTDGEIFECSQQHFDDDSYRVRQGDNQR